jgi:cell division transport system permease protein
MKIDYILRETANNLRRNVTLTVAAIVTVAVSLALFGSALLLRSGVDNATTQWQNDVEFIVYMQPNVTPEQRDSLLKSLQESPDVKDLRYVDQAKTYEEFKQLFKRSPQLVENVTPEILPPSYRVVPRISDAEVVRALGAQFAKKAGVREVVNAYDTIKTIQKVSNLIGTRIVFGSVALLVAACLLILNTIRTAMFARRREIEVMKLVGATNWFIRVPFMLEGVVHGLFGSLAAVGIVVFLRSDFDKLSGSVRLFQGFAVDSSEVFTTSAVVVAVGVLIGAIGSAFAVSRFLDV